ncbi:cyanate transporter [Archangium lansingense]|uniref:Cyanate transporter n=1 Tax=Archangium lansingense TaxID=2995310 RepID=A0ABT4AIL8_9BACT|nr:cyanate transporter [Archangium lansinium]MCY1080707.1 cyanate transporter [Archangium lansinium]
MRFPPRAILLLTLVFIGLNLRPFLTGIGPLVASIAADTGLGYRGLAWLTMLPTLLMGAGAFLGPWIQRELGGRRIVLGALTMLGLGSALRIAVPSGSALIGTAALCGMGVAAIQAVMPGLIKENFPRGVAPITGVYSAALMAGGAAGAQLTPVLADIVGSWRGALAWLAAPAGAALVLGWWVLPRAERASAGHTAVAVLLRRPRTWLLMSCFGLVNAGYSSMVAWLPAYYLTRGWSKAHSGGLVALMAVAQAAAALSLPALAARSHDRRPWLWLTLFAQATSFAGLAFWPDASPRLWAALGGAGLGGCFALSLVVALDHLHEPAQAGALSALMQGGGFLIAANGPWLMAVLQERSGSFATGWLAHLACVLLVIYLVTRLAPDGYGAAMNGTQASSRPGTA